MGEKGGGSVNCVKKGGPVREKGGTAQIGRSGRPFPSQ